MSTDPKSIGQKFAQFCVLVLLGVLAIWLAFEVLARIWGWLLLVAVLLGLGYVGHLLLRRRTNRW